jgi:hypothetical protein
LEKIESESGYAERKLRKRAEFEAQRLEELRQKKPPLPE